MNNNKGYILIYAIGLLTLLLLITATLTSITFTRTHWSKDQVALIQDTTLAKAQVEACASDMANYFTEINHLPKNERKYLNEMINEIQNYFNELRNRYNVEIIPEHFDDTDKYSFELLIRYSVNNVTAEKKVYLSMMPSFLFFALGSNTNLNLNGGVYIDGNLYVNDTLYLTNSANYILNNNRKSIPSFFPSINYGNSIFFSTRQKIQSCYLYEECFNVEDGKFIKQNYAQEDINLIFNEIPIIREYPNNFLDVNFDEAFLYYLENDVITKEFMNNYSNLHIDNLDTTLIKLYEDGIIDNFFEKTNTKSALINDNYTLQTDLDFTEDGVKKHWVIVNGDLEIKNYDNNNILNINANFLVTGNIIITGYVQLNSTIYALGEGLVHNASINVNISNENEQLVLLTKEKLKFSKINEFDNRFLGIVENEDGSFLINPTIKGFFYTDSYSEIYTVNSYLVIEGGIFSNDNKNKTFDSQGERIINEYITNTDSIGLLINSYRGEVHDNKDGTFKFIESNEDKNARFIIKHNTSILESQPKGLPLTKDFNFLFDKTKLSKR